jgi:hypothetical protein
VTEHTLTLEQRRATRREWQLVEQGDVTAVLRIALFGSGARATARGRHINIERHGRLRAGYAVREGATGTELARLRRRRPHMILELGDRNAEWQRLSRTDGFGFVAADGTVLLRAKIRSGILRTAGEIKINATLTACDAVVAALLAAYLLIRKMETEQAATSAAAAAAAGS